MNKNNNSWLIIIISGLFIAFIVFAYFSQQAKIIYFYGDNCPHCKIVSSYLDENDVDKKIKFKKLEVWKNANNANVLKAKATLCKLDTNNIPVPFLFDGQDKCFIGSDQIISFFAEISNEAEN